MKCRYLILLLCLAIEIQAKNTIYSPQIKTLQSVVNKDWLAPTVMRLNSDDIINIDFDDLSDNINQYIYKIERCEVDWRTSTEVFESDWLEGFNNNSIDEFGYSTNTTIPYIHYHLQIPNDQCRFKLSGNYRLNIIKETNDEIVASVEFMVSEQSMSLALQLSANTDIDFYKSHQQITASLNYNKEQIANAEEQIILIVTQNNRDDNSRKNIRPTYVSEKSLEWTHCIDLIFEAGNEYHKYEILDVSHPTMGIDFIHWDGNHYQVYPFINNPRLQYIYDQDANGSFYIRNSNNTENETTCDYVWVNYRLHTPQLLNGNIYVQGRWTTEKAANYLLHYNAEEQVYQAYILQKQGYYSYQYLWQKNDGTSHFLPSEGNFYQTENRYQAYIYYKKLGERTWRLTAAREILSE